MNRVVFSSASDHWATPKDTYDALNTEFEFDFDPCPLLSQESGLMVRWAGRVFCNPPYSHIAEFLKKGLFHLAAGDCALLVYLLPARTDTRWFHDYCMRAGEIRFLRGRLKFGDAKTGAPFPSVVVIFKEWAISPLALDGVAA